MYTLFDTSKKYSGNKTTLKRLKNILNLKVSKEISSYSIAINAYNFGTELNNINGETCIKDFIVILGGSDVYEHINDDGKKKLIESTLGQSKWIVSFNKDMKQRILDNFEISCDKIRIIPQSVSTKLKASQYDLYNTLNISRDKKIFIMVGNLRPIKRPDFLFNCFKKNKKEVLIIIGEMNNQEYIFPENVFHINGLKKRDIYACMKQSNGLINCSINEGMSSAILEAMALRCPVYAFRNPGNMSIIKDDFNGYLFSSKSDFSFIIKLPTKHIIKNAFDYVSVNHLKRNEQSAYSEILELE